MKTVRIEYSRMATVICSRALGRRPTTAVMVRRPPMMTMAAAPANWLLGETPMRLSTLGPMVITSMRTKPPKAMSISQPVMKPT